MLPFLFQFISLALSLTHTQLFIVIGDFIQNTKVALLSPLKMVSDH